MNRGMIVARLRSLAERISLGKGTAEDTAYWEAADHIEKLEAENAGLRGVLEIIKEKTAKESQRAELSVRKKIRPVGSAARMHMANHIHLIADQALAKGQREVKDA